LYLSLLQMCIIPLVVTAITTSFAKLMHSKLESQLVRRMIVIFISLLLVTAGIGAIVAWIGNIGGSMTESSQNNLGRLLLQADQTVQAAHINVSNLVESFVSPNIFTAFTDGNNIAILVFSILLGIALGYITSKSGQVTLAFFDGLFNTFLMLVNGIMYVLPLGLFALIASEIAKSGFEMFSVAGELILYTYIIGIILTLVFMWVVSRRAKISYFSAFYHLREMMLVGFVSGNSFAALPFGIASLIQHFKLSKTKVNLFFPLSVCLNPVGNSYFLALVTVFIAHLYGQSVGLHEILFIIVFSSLTAVAIGGIPIVAGFAFISMIFTPLGLPTSTALVLLIAISNILDPIVTLVDVTGNAMTTSLLSTPEETLQEELEELVSRPRK
ncbi:MAG: dicarboxylate/amino acid:cation symporter, partial [Gammaproteobacteria bacterium]|nr:dicarboxylate/amino acid:cation symporter [Gammaproteobacteria bacterium]